MADPIPVYLIAGFLDGGKTSFINGILSDGFAAQDRTLLLCCEEGEAAYDEKLLRNVTVVTAEDPLALTPDFLTEKQRACRAAQVLVEFNGMWLLQDFYARSMPQDWVLYQIVVVAEAPTFELYMKNMASLMSDKLRNADMIIINRCTAELCGALRKRNLKLINRRASIYLELEDGGSEDYMDGTVSAFDLTADVLRISDEDYGLWYVEVMDSPQMYDGKTVVFRAMMCKPPKYKPYFTPGRFAMVCCAEDMNFLAVACKDFDVKDIREKTWVEVTAVVRKEYWKPYRGDGPILHVQKIVPCEKPAEEIVRM